LADVGIDGYATMGDMAVLSTIKMPRGYGSEAFLHEEKFPMTLVLGLVGSDGWILASDTCVVYDRFQVDQHGRITNATFRANSRKLRWFTDIKLACAFAGDHVSQFAGEMLARRL
jgi:hypothetical protein